MNIEIVELNQKQRKGLYIRIKEPKKSPRYYKIKENETIKPYVRYYQDKYINKKKVKLSDYKREKEVRQKKVKQVKTRKAPLINKTIKKGLGYAVIKDLKGANNNTIKKQQREC